MRMRRYLFLLIVLFSLMLMFQSPVKGYDTPEFRRGDTILLEATLVDDLGNPIPNETVLFFDETENFLIGSSKTDEYGVSKLYWTIQDNVSLGLHTINTTYMGDPENYILSSFERTTIKVVSDILLYYSVYDTDSERMDRNASVYDEFKVEVIALDDLGTPLNGLSVELREGEKLLAQNVTDIDGKTTLTLHPQDLGEGEHEITILTSVDDPSYVPYEDNFLISVYKLVPSIKLINETLDLVLGENKTKILGSLECEGSPLPDKIVLLKDEMGNTFSTSYTDENGTFELEVPIYKISEEPGDYGVKVVFQGDHFYKSYEVNVPIKLRSPVYLELDCEDYVSFGSGSALKISILDLNFEPIKCCSVIVGIDGKEFEEKTNDEGIIVFYLNSTMQIGIHNISVHFPSQSIYDEASLNKSIYVLMKPEIEFITPPRYYSTYGENLNISVKLFLGGSPIADEDIVLVLNGDVISREVTDGEGKASFSFSHSSDEDISTLKLVVHSLRDLDRFLDENEVEFTVLFGKFIRTEVKGNVSLEGRNILIELMVFDSMEGEPLDTGSFLLFLNGSLFDTLEVKSDGVEVYFEVPEEFSGKKLNITAYYEMNDVYYCSSFVEVIEVPNLSKGLSFPILPILMATIPSSLAILVFIRRKNSVNLTRIYREMKLKSRPVFHILLILTMVFSTLNFSTLYGADVGASVNIELTNDAAYVGGELNFTMNYYLKYPSNGYGYVSVQVYNDFDELILEEVYYEQGFVSKNFTLKIWPEGWSPINGSCVGRIEVWVEASGYYTVWDSDTKEFSVMKGNVSIGGYDVVDLSYYDPIELNLTLSNSIDSNITVSGMLVNWSVMDENDTMMLQGSKITDEDGNICLNFSSIGLGAGNFSIRLESEGDEDYNGFIHELPLIVRDARIFVLIDLSRDYVYGKVDYDENGSRLMINVSAFGLDSLNGTHELKEFEPSWSSNFSSGKFKNSSNGTKYALVDFPRAPGLYEVWIHVDSENHENFDGMVEVEVRERPYSIIMENVPPIVPTTNYSINFKVIDETCNKTPLGEEVLIGVNYKSENSSGSIYQGSIKVSEINTITWHVPKELFLGNYMDLEMDLISFEGCVYKNSSFTFRIDISNDMKLSFPNYNDSNTISLETKRGLNQTLLIRISSSNGSGIGDLDVEMLSGSSTLDSVVTDSKGEAYLSLDSYSLHPGFNTLYIYVKIQDEMILLGSIVLILWIPSEVTLVAKEATVLTLANFRNI
ncbi:MAG: MSCRAMM family protein [Candidatus Asgardarchaeia archaeon]